jgi:hypothetical protein
VVVKIERGVIDHAQLSRVLMGFWRSSLGSMEKVERARMVISVSRAFIKRGKTMGTPLLPIAFEMEIFLLSKYTILLKYGVN